MSYEQGSFADKETHPAHKRWVCVVLRDLSCRSGEKFLKDAQEKPKNRLDRFGKTGKEQADEDEDDEERKNASEHGRGIKKSTRE